MATGLENLKIYQMSRELELKVFELTKKFPKDEFYRSVDQVRRSSSSVTNNIAEGYGKQSQKERVRIFNDIVKGEANETRGNLEMCLQKGFHKDQKIIDDYTQLIKATSGFVNFLRNSSSLQLKNFQTSKLQTVLGVDPGFDRVGVAVLDQTSLLFSDCIVTDRKQSHAERLLFIGEALQKIIRKWKPGALAIETLFFNQNTTSAIGVAQARGVILYEAARAGLRVSEYGPQAVKIAVTGYGKADKLQMESMVRKLVSVPASADKRLDDELDAIAVGITHLATQKGI